MTRLRRAAGRLLLAVLWILGALVISVGGAGIVAAISHTPGSPARAELTWAADEAIRPGLAGALDDLDALAADVRELGKAGRAALAALNARDTEAAARAVSDGTLLVRGIDTRAAALRATLDALPGVGPGAAGRLGWGVRTEYAAIGGTIELTKGLRAQWAVLTSGSTAATRLTTLLARHDIFVADAVRFGNKRDWTAATISIQRASVRLDAASALRDVLAATADVGTLSEWIARNRAIDDALLALYRALQASGGKPVDAVRKALAAVDAARAQLPPDTRGLIVIMDDLARGGLNQAVIAIEEAGRGLDDAVAAIRAANAAADAGATGRPGASPAADPTSSPAAP